MLEKEMPAWIHDRADHIRSKNPGMPKGEAFAIATQQSYVAGKAPSKYGTTEGRRKAKKKYNGNESEYELKANPSHKVKTSENLILWKGFSDEMQKIAAVQLKLTGPKTITKSVTPKLPAEKSNDPMNGTKTLPPPPVVC
jgi:hypothetical protein